MIKMEQFPLHIWLGPLPFYFKISFIDLHELFSKARTSAANSTCSGNDGELLWTCYLDEGAETAAAAPGTFSLWLGNICSNNALHWV